MSVHHESNNVYQVAVEKIFQTIVIEALTKLG